MHSTETDPDQKPNQNQSLLDMVDQGLAYVNEDGEICIGIPLPTNQELGLEPGLE